MLLATEEGQTVADSVGEWPPVDPDTASSEFDSSIEVRQSPGMAHLDRRERPTPGRVLTTSVVIFWLVA